MPGKPVVRMNKAQAPTAYGVLMQSGGGGGGGGDKFIRNVALNLILLGAYFVFESFGDGGGFFGGGGGGDSGE